MGQCVDKEASIKQRNEQTSIIFHNSQHLILDDPFLVRAD